jgi:hypothetical protein
MTQNPFAVPDEVENILVNIWYPWTQAQREFLGCKGSSAFRHVAPQRGSTYADADEYTVKLNRNKAEKADWCIDRLSRNQQIAVDLHCANQNGAAVWRSGRLSPEDVLDLYQEAKAALIPDMILKELITREAA